MKGALAGKQSHLLVLAHRLWPSLGLVALVFLAYANSFTNGFMLDDHTVLLGQFGVENKSFASLFTAHQGGGFFRPVGHVFLWIFSRFFHHQVILYHLANLLLFTGAVLLFDLIVRRLSGNRWVAWWAAALYAAHPINSMFVNYVTASVLTTFLICMQAAFLFLMRWADTRRVRDYALSFVFALLAMLSHEMAVMFFLYAALFLFIIKRAPWKKVVSAVWPFAVFPGIYLAWRAGDFLFHRTIDGTSQAALMPSSFFSTWVSLCGWYLSKLVYPKDLIFLWSAQFASDFVLLKILACAVLFLGAVMLIVMRWKRSVKTFAVVVFAAGFIPTVSACFTYHPTIRPFIEPHWLAFASIGFFILAGFLIIRVMRWRKAGGAVLGIVLLAGLLMYSWQYNARWADQETYCRYWLGLNRGNLTPFQGLGQSLMKKGDVRGALEVFTDGIFSLNTNNVLILADTGYCYFLIGDMNNAARFLNAAVQENEYYALTYHYIGLVYAARGDRPRADAAFRRAVHLDPRFSPSRAYVR